MNFPPITYLSMDALTSGIGTSQVAPYVEGLARRGLDVTVHSFEHAPPSPAARQHFHESGVRWEPHPFGAPGARGGLVRTLQAARWCRGAALLHARADVSAAAALVARPERWLWDIRSFWREQRIELDMLAPGSPEERILRAVERRSAASCTVAVALARAAVPVLVERHGPAMEAKTRVIPTCVDLDRFRPGPAPTSDHVVALLSGSLNRYYDMPTMVRLIEHLRHRRPTTLAVLAPAATAWDDQLAIAGAERRRATFEEMPAHVAAAHFGLSVCRADLGESLRAAMPTKLAEFLACGRPVVVNRGLGDMDEIIDSWRCGIVVEGDGPNAVADASDRLLDLLAEDDLSDRCRAAAEATFDLDHGLDRLIASYTQAVMDSP